MTDEKIEFYIDALNASEMRDKIFLAKLSDKVDFAKVCVDEPNGILGNENPYDFYFIKNNEGIYVAAILDMFNDLHAFVKKKYRGKSDLAKAMVSVILPKLYQDGRKTQNVTFTNSKVGKYCARSWGFTLTGEFTAEKVLSVFAEVPDIPTTRQNISKEEFAEIKININKAIAYVNRVKTKLEMSYGGCEDTKIGYLLRDLYGLDDELLYFIEEEQGRLF